jgi:GrpB-like predicted nucleotidyltransferase (UPF0157 family)
MNDPNIGLERGKVKLIPHQSTWHNAFEAEKTRLRTILKNRPIEHVGSTAIAGLAAKPIIDIAIAIDSLAEAEELIQPLAKLDYEYKGEAGTPGRRFFVKGPDENRTVYLHFGKTNGEFGTLVRFRDTLLRRPDLIGEYNSLKRSLAEKFADNRKAYTSGKSEFIRKVLQDGLIDSAG